MTCAIRGCWSRRAYPGVATKCICGPEEAGPWSDLTWSPAGHPSTAIGRISAGLTRFLLHLQPQVISKKRFVFLRFVSGFAFGNGKSLIGLPQVIVRAQLGCRHPISFLLARRQHDDRHSGIGAYTARDVHSVLTGQL